MRPAGGQQGMASARRDDAQCADGLKRLALPEKWLNARPKRMQFQQKRVQAVCRAWHGIRQQVTPHTLHLLRLNSRLQDFRPAWTFCSKILLGGNKHIETLQRSDGFEGRL